MTTQIITTNIHTLDFTSLLGTTITLKNIFVSLNIYESIFNNFKIGKIIIKDTFDLQQIFPIVGGEVLEIFFTSDNDKSGNRFQKFLVYNVDSDHNIQAEESNKKLITLYFCSPEMITDYKSSISKRFKDKTPESVLGYLLNTVFGTKKKFLTHPTKNELDFITNFWSPSRIIQYVEKHSIGKFDDFIFYENIDGFNFKSISKLMSEGPSHTIKFADDQDMLYKYDFIKGKMMKKYFNDFEGLKSGVYGNTYFKLEPFFYGFNKFEQDFDTVTRYNTSLGRHVQHRSELKNFNEMNLTFDNGDHLTKRSLILKSLSKYHQIIKLNGDSTKTVGQIYDFLIERRTREVNENNELLNGKWFVTNINHELFRDGTYTQIAKITKNAFQDFNTFANVKGGKHL